MEIHCDMFYYQCVQVISNILSLKENVPQASINPVITVTNMQSARLKEIYEDFKIFSTQDIFIYIFILCQVYNKKSRFHSSNDVIRWRL